MTSVVTQPTCLRCSEQQVTCCNDNPRVPLTISDVTRISSLGYQDFLTVGEYDPESLKEDEPWWVQGMTVVDGRHYRLNVVKHEGVCRFLNPGHGCLLGGDRPAVCKIFPFWVLPTGEIGYEPGEENFCTMSRTGVPLLKAVLKMGETDSSIRGYFEEIRTDSTAYPIRHARLICKLLKG